MTATTITVTRHYSGVANRADTFSIGDREHEGNAAATKYLIPESYTLDKETNELVDPDGFVCRIVEGGGRKPFVMSTRGTRPDVYLLESA